jgi:tRNA/rRNA methyltransferase
VEQKRGVLFGPERTGLDNDEVALADAVLTFPTNPAYGSLNLAQAVLLVGYEWFQAAHGDAPPAPAVEKAPALPAKRETVVAFFEYLEEKLDAVGFFKPEGKRPLMQRNLRNIFHRLELTEQDISTLWGVVVRLVDGPRESVQTRKRNRPPKNQP